MRTVGQCIFCTLEKSRIIDETEFYYVIRDAFPVSELHTLVIPKRHSETYFDLSEDELSALPDILKCHRDLILREDRNVTGFNIGINVGEDAGQTIFHCHIHLIPRRKGDLENPRGGVRGVIPNKRIY
jgi:ATP adenylyltransferase